MDNNTLLEDLELAISKGSAQSRLAALSYTTDLLIAGRYTEQQIWMFDEIVGLLASEIEISSPLNLPNVSRKAGMHPARLFISSLLTNRLKSPDRYCGTPSS